MYKCCQAYFRTRAGFASFSPLVKSTYMIDMTLFTGDANQQISPNKELAKSGLDA
jgi:hypothetical protein